MADEPRTEEYLGRFSGEFEPKSRQAEALKQALDIRKFEIELYWKRATYFWAFIALAFGAYFLLGKDTNEHAKISTYLVSSLGFVFSVAWYCVNRGSKAWQRNWEHHVDLLEDRVMGPLYKTTLNRRTYKFVDLFDAFPYSPSKINTILSLFLSAIWLILLCLSAKNIGFANIQSDFFAMAITLLTVLATGLLLWLGQTSRSDNPIDIEMRLRTISSARIDESMTSTIRAGGNHQLQEAPSPQNSNAFSIGMLLIAGASAFIAWLAFLSSQQQWREQSVVSAWQTVQNWQPQQGNIGIGDALALLNAEKRSLKRLVLGGAWLEHADLRGADLSWSDFSVPAGHQVTGFNHIKLSNAVLSPACLKGGDLQYADFRGAILGGADFRNIVNWHGVRLDDADIEGADLRGSSRLNESNALTCNQLTKAKNWQKAFRDGALSCGANIPERGHNPGACIWPSMIPSTTNAQ